MTDQILDELFDELAGAFAALEGKGRPHTESQPRKPDLHLVLDDEPEDACDSDDPIDLKLLPSPDDDEQISAEAHVEGDIHDG